MSKDKEKGEKLETNTNKEEVKKIKVNDDAKGCEEKENVIKNDRKLILPIAIISILILVLIFSGISAIFFLHFSKTSLSCSLNSPFSNNPSKSVSINL